MRKDESLLVPSDETVDGTFSGRLKHVIGARSYREFADSMDVSEGTVRNYLKGGSPKLDVLEKICKIEGIDLNWLIAGVGHAVKRDNSISFPIEAAEPGFESISDSMPDSSEVPDSEVQEVSYQVIDKPELDEEFILVPGYHARIPSKCGSLDQSEHKVKRFLAFRRKYLNYKKLEPSKLAVVFAAGDAMDGNKGTIKDNDTLLVDLNSNQPMDGKIFVVRLGDEIHPRRLQKGFDGSITLICDNEEYSKQIIPKELVKDLEIIGRVVHRATDL
ncbi:putative prophage MuSo1, transcriptional regulator, Cro/CI family [Photobacterium marinum]|uniref:Putative prophage MuSo1, transcriptional regulator, Cro/CI family n=1 Tax=Photobacterium marinum TaxID=1056511 RepID=L8JAR6_9GAMM|nr:LexA family transcriptional regulator [Photobacterium marinum]ELR65881.1 putative prophage MuSo1, transcriptional regulator, Cro/CI family [Photobacterium marinum]